MHSDDWSNKQRHGEHLPGAHSLADILQPKPELANREFPLVDHRFMCALRPGSIPFVLLLSAPDTTCKGELFKHFSDRLLCSVNAITSN